MREGRRVHGGLEDPRRVHAPLQRHRGRAAGGRGRRVPGKDELRRVRNGVLQRELRLLAGPQPLVARSRARRLQWRIGGGRRVRRGDRRAGQRHRRLDPSAGGAHRHRGYEADLRTRQPLRSDRLRLVARSDRSDDPRCGRRCAAAASHRRQRPSRFNQLIEAGAGLSGNPDGWSEGHAPRRAEGILRSRHGTGGRAVDP